MTLNSASTLISGAVAARAAQRSQLPVRAPCLRARHTCGSAMVAVLAMPLLTLIAEAEHEVTHSTSKL